MYQSVGRVILFVGIVMTIVGGLLYLMGRLGIGRLPGDFQFGGKGWRVYVPLGTSLLVSAILTLILYLAYRLRR